MGAFEDYKDDWQCDDFVETVSLLAADDYEGQNPVEDVKARRGEIAIDDYRDAVVVESGEAPWVVFVDTIREPFAFGPGVLIRVSENEVWRVLRCAMTVAGTRYFCSAQLLPAS